jgi:hypothetical protein
VVPTLIPADETWQTYENATLGLQLRYPSGWLAIEGASQTSVAFYPAGADPSVPSPLIAISFNASQSYPTRTELPASINALRMIEVSGIDGRAFEDSGFTVPTHGFYVQLPYRGGTLLITATLGPEVNLVPQLEEMLATVVLLP